MKKYKITFKYLDENNETKSATKEFKLNPADYNIDQINLAQAQFIIMHDISMNFNVVDFLKFETVPKLNFFKHPMDNYSIYLTDLKMRGCENER